MHAHAACAYVPKGNWLGKPQRAVRRLARASAGAPARPTPPAVEQHPPAAMAMSLGSPAWVGVWAVRGCTAARQQRSRARCGGAEAA